jgi:hypothetical protein
VHVEERERVVRDEGQRPGQHLEQDHPERVDVARGLGRFSRRLFRGDVCGRAENGPRLGERPVTGCAAGEAEVGQLRPAFLIEQNVRRFEVSMNEIPRVEVRETRCNALGHPPCLLGWERPASKPVVERSAR